MSRNRWRSSCRVWVLFLAASKKVVMVGIPGVGKTSLISVLAKMLSHNNHRVSVHSFGSVMLEEARKAGITDRDMLRKATIEDQQKYQNMAAEKLAKMADEIVIIDTHAFISTPAGFYPGLPDHVLRIIRPSSMISVHARPEEIYNRRMSDTTRNRDKITIDRIKRELSVQESMVSACSVLSGAPVKTVLNLEGKIEDAASSVIRALGI